MACPKSPFPLIKDADVVYAVRQQIVIIASLAEGERHQGHGQCVIELVLDIIIAGHHVIDARFGLDGLVSSVGVFAHKETFLRSFFQKFVSYMYAVNLRSVFPLRKQGQNIIRGQICG